MEKHKASDCWYKQTNNSQGEGKGTRKSTSKVTEISESDDSKQVDDWNPSSNMSAQQPNLLQVNMIGCADEKLWIFYWKIVKNVGTRWHATRPIWLRSGTPRSTSWWSVLAVHRGLHHISNGEFYKTSMLWKRTTWHCDTTDIPNWKPFPNPNSCPI